MNQWARDDHNQSFDDERLKALTCTTASDLHKTNMVINENFGEVVNLGETFDE